MKVWEIMKEPPAKLLPRAPLVVARRIFRDTEARVIPIVNDERLNRVVGFLTRVETIIPTSTKSNLRVIDVARDHPLIRADASIEEVVKTMEEFGVYAAPVVDEEERLLGVISLRDIIEVLSKQGVKPKVETVSEIMNTEDIDRFMVEPDERINRVWSKFVYRGLPAVVVVRSKQEPYPIGILTPFDLIRKGRWRFHREIQAGKIVAPAKVKRVMTRGVIVATPDTRIDDVVKFMVENDFSVIPVVDDEGRMIGIVTQMDVVKAYLEEAKPERVKVKVEPKKEVYVELGLKAKDIARSEMPAITINDTVEHARNEMLRRKTNYLLVIDEAGRIVGVVTKWNMLRALALKGPLWRRRVYDKFFIDYVMDKVIPRVKADEPLENVAFKLVSNGVDVAIVEGEDGEIIGFITKDDLVEAYARSQVGKLLVENVMVPGNMALVHPHHSLAHVVNKMKTLGLDALVVYDGSRIVGVVSTNRLPFVAYEDAPSSRKSRRLIWVRKLVKGGAKKARFVKVAPLVAADATVEVEKTLRPEDDIIKAIEYMKEENVNGLPVVDETGRPIGVITKNVILREMARHSKVAVERVRTETTEARTE